MSMSKTSYFLTSIVTVRAAGGRLCDASGLRTDIVALDPAKIKVLETRVAGARQHAA